MKNWNGAANSVYIAGNDVYVVGYEIHGKGNHIATLWKNGEVQYLTDGTYNAEANSVYVAGSDVFVAGWEENVQFHSGVSYRAVAILWKNGIAQNLSDGSKSARAHSVYVYSNDVYVAGCEDIYPTIAKLWKNGIAQDLIVDGEANSVYVSGNDVYVAGFESRYPSIAKLWKNGSAQNLTNNGRANSIFVSGNDVYVAGIDNSVATLWKNGSAKNLTNNGQANSVFVSGSDVYVAGEDRQVSKLWKNGVAQDLIIDGEAKFVYVSGNDVYVAGCKKWSSSLREARLWKNGTEQNLADINSKSIFLLIRKHSIRLDTVFSFGKYIGKTVEEVVKLQPSYLNWCVTNVERFYISDEVIKEIQLLKPNFSLSEKEILMMAEKYESWRNKKCYARVRVDESYDEYCRDTWDALTDGQYGDYEDGYDMSSMGRD